MASLQKIDNPTKGGGNASYAHAGMELGPQGITDPPPDDAVSQAISEAAYYRAAARGFVSGHELEDWIAAEQEVIAWHYSVDDADGV